MARPAPRPGPIRRFRIIAVHQAIPSSERLARQPEAMARHPIIAVRTAVRCRAPNALPPGAMPQQRAIAARTGYAERHQLHDDDSDAGDAGLSVQWLGVADGSLYLRKCALLRLRQDGQDLPDYLDRLL